MKKSKSKGSVNTAYTTNNIIVFCVLISVIIVFGIYYYMNYMNKNKKEKSENSKTAFKNAPLPTPKPFKIGESLAGTQWEIISLATPDDVKSKIDPFKVVFDNDKKGHLEKLTKRTQDFIFGKEFTYSYDPQLKMYFIKFGNKEWLFSMVEEHPNNAALMNFVHPELSDKMAIISLCRSGSTGCGSF